MPAPEPAQPLPSASLAQGSPGAAAAQASPGPAPAAPAQTSPNAATSTSPQSAPSPVSASTGQATSPAAAQPASSQTPASQRPALTTIRVLTQGQTALFDLLVPGFHAKYGQYRVEVVTPPPGVGMIDQTWLRKTVADGGLDLLVFWQSDMSFLVKENLLTPLDPLIRKTGFDLTPLGPTADLLRFNGHLLDLPVVNHPNVLYYNQQLWQAVGLKPPRPDWTWDELRHAAQKLTSGSGDAKVWGLSTNYLISLPEMYIWQRTGRMPWEADEQTIKETLQLFSTMIFADGIIKPDPLLNRPGWELQGQEFWEGRAGLYLGRMYDLLRLERQSTLQWDIAPLPTAAGGRSAGSANFITYAIPSTARNPEAAWALLSMMAGEEGASVMARAGYLPAYITPAVREAWFDRTPVPPPGTATLFETTWVLKPRDLDFQFFGLPFRVSEAISDTVSGRKSWEDAYADYLRAVQQAAPKQP